MVLFYSGPIPCGFLRGVLFVLTLSTPPSFRFKGEKRTPSRRAVDGLVPLRTVPSTISPVPSRSEPAGVEHGYKKFSLRFHTSMDSRRSLDFRTFPLSPNLRRLLVLPIPSFFRCWTIILPNIPPPPAFCRPFEISQMLPFKQTPPKDVSFTSEPAFFHFSVRGSGPLDAS